MAPPVITRNMYDEAKRYVETVLQAGVPIVDADYNDQMQSFYTQMRRLIINGFGDGARGVAFKIEQNSLFLANDFLIRGGSVQDEGPEELFAKGMQAQLAADETYMGLGETQPLSTAIVGNQLFDTSANWTVNEFAGRTLIPNMNTPANQFSIVSNTATSITCAAPIAGVASARDPYRIKLSTPLANRTDLVYLDVYLAEYSKDEDADLLHTIDSMTIEAMQRKKLMQRVWVQQGITLPVCLPSGYTDVNGDRHVLIPLALIARPAGNANITDAMITDLRRKIYRLDESGDLFVNVSGDTMTGPLVMEADIVMASGQKVTGLCVIDGNAICPEAVEQRHLKRDSHLLGDLDQVPTWEEVNDPSDEHYFKVHDNRYYRKAEVDDLIGSNLLSNGTFENGLECWENAVPSVLYGGPQAEGKSVV